LNKRFYLEMKKEQFRTCEAAEAMAATILWQSETSFSLFERQLGVKSELTSLILAQERRDGMGVREIAHQRTSPRRSGGIRALPEVREDHWRPYWQKLKMQNVATITVFYIAFFRKSSSYLHLLQYYTYSTVLSQLTCDEEGLHTICFD
jgi:hypothetical protein